MRKAGSMNKLFRILSIAGIFMIISSLSYGHMSWIRIEKTGDAGESFKITVAHGHKFPQGEERLSAEFLKIYYVSESGVKSPFNFEKPAAGLSGLFKVVEPGIQRFSFIYDRGVMSKTTQGWKTGGKDKYPKAIGRIRTVQTGTSLLKTGSTAWNEIAPVGLPVELLPVKFGKEITVSLLKDGKAYAGADIIIQLPGKDEKAVGKTDSKGEIKIVFPVEKGEILIGAEFRIDNPAGSEVNRENYAASLYLNLE
jgi:uncharacterized GH25 family protein